MGKESGRQDHKHRYLCLYRRFENWAGGGVISEKTSGLRVPTLLRCCVMHSRSASIKPGRELEMNVNR